MQVAVLPRANLHDSFAITRSLHIDVLRSRNGAFSSGKRILCNGRKQWSRVINRKRLYVSRCSSGEKAAYAVKEVTDEDLEKEVQPSDVRVLAAIRSRSVLLDLISWAF